jgi:hypothetical protein
VSFAVLADGPQSRLLLLPLKTVAPEKFRIADPTCPRHAGNVSLAPKSTPATRTHPPLLPYASDDMRASAVSQHRFRDACHGQKRNPDSRRGFFVASADLPENQNVTLQLLM